MTTMQQIAAATNASTRLNENFDALSGFAIFGKKASTSTGLTWGYYGGIYAGATVADGTVTLTNSAANYLVVARATGVVSASTGTTNWNDSNNYARLYKVTTSGGVPTVTEDHRMNESGLFSVEPAPERFIFTVPVSDETSALTTGAAKVTFRMPCAVTLESVRASANIAPTGAAIQVDINEEGASILSTKLTIDATEKTSTTAATPAVISDTALADDAEITIDIDQVGSTIAGAGLKVTLIGRIA